MAKEELMEFEGSVSEVLPDARFRVKLDNGHEMIAYTAGKMKKNRIKTIEGDRVTVEMSPYDLDKGRIIFRHKDERAAAAPRPPQRGGGKSEGIQGVAFLHRESRPNHQPAAKLATNRSGDNHG